MKIAALLLAVTIATPALAQMASPSSQAGNGSGQQTETGPDGTRAVMSANAGIAGDVAARRFDRRMNNADVRRQYDADLAAYDRSIMAHHRAVRRSDRAYQRQQRAYADAMAQWRFQTAECKRGVLKMCRKPTPDPADYF